MDNATEKDKLRKAVRALTQRLPVEYITRSDRGILENLIKLDAWKQAQTVFIYLSVGREADTRGAIRAALDAGKAVAVPRCLDGGEMEARVIASPDGLRPGRFGSLEPDETQPLLQPREIDLVVAPCMAADRQGYRLGHGGGYYDRYLARVRCTTVCLCRERLLRGNIPHDVLDQRVSRVITESGSIDCSTYTG